MTGQDRWDRTTSQDKRGRTAITGKLVYESRDRTAGTGQSEQVFLTVQARNFTGGKQ
jgi:hypothetical protein